MAYVLNRFAGQGGGESASIFVTGLNETDNVTATLPNGSTKSLRWVSKPKPLPSGCIAEWLFNDNLLDTSGEGNDLTNNGVTFTTCELSAFSKCAVFNGSSYGRIAKSMVGANSPVSYSNWFKYTTAGNVSMWGGDQHSKARTLNLVERTSFGLRFEVMGGRSGGSPVGNANTSSLYNDGQWHYVACTWTGTTESNGLKIYIDGQLIAQGTSSTVLSSTTANFDLGQAYYNDYFIGSMAGFRIYDKVLSADEITQLYNEGQGTPTTVQGWELTATDFGLYTITATDGTHTTSQSVLVDGVAEYVVEMSYAT